MGITMGKWPDFEYYVGKWLKYDRSGYNSSHPSLGSPWDLGNPWRPLATMPENGQNGHFQLQPVYWLKKTRRFAWRPQSPGITTTTHGIVTVSRKLRWPGTLKSISSPKLYIYYILYYTISSPKLYRLGLKCVDPMTPSSPMLCCLYFTSRNRPTMNPARPLCKKSRKRRRRRTVITDLSSQLK